MQRMPLLAAASIALGLLAACNANLSNNCLAGPCNDDAGVLSAPVGAGGAGGGPCAVLDDTIDACDVASMPTTGDIPCNVWNVMHTEPVDEGGCHRCHQSPMLNGAPFPETSYEALLLPSHYSEANPDERIFQTMLKALQPVPPAPLTHMPFPGSTPLSCDGLHTLTSWLRGDGTPTGCAKPVPEGMGDATCCPKTDMDVDAGCL